MELNGRAFELDFLPVGEGARSGDALAMRIGRLGGPDDVVVIDGGDREAGRRLVDHVRSYYGDLDYIDHVVCTHPDDDHTSGLREVLEEFSVGTLWIHQPWLHAAELIPAFRHNWSVEGLAQRLREDFAIPYELCLAASAKGSVLKEPFQGERVNGLEVLAPSYGRYLDLVPTMTRSPEARYVTEAAGGLMKSVRDAVLSVLETWGKETLDTPRPGDTSPTNESSVVLFGDFGDARVLLTGDAGVEALREAIDFAEALGHRVHRADCVQMPHHGSRRNVSPAILDRLLGRVDLSGGGERRGWAIACASKGDSHHPRKVVQNAFRRRGYLCSQTHGGVVNYNHGMPPRAGLVPIRAEPFHDIVED